MEHEELIQKYFNNTLSQDEANDVSKRLETDPEFETLFNEYKDVQIAFKINEKAALKKHLTTLDQKSLPFYKTLLKNKTILIAIASCLIVGLFYFNSRHTASELFDTYYDRYPNVYQPIVRGDNTTKNTEAFKAYENGNYLKAEDAFNAVLKTNNDNNIRFYYAMSLLNQDKITEANKVLDNLKTKEHNFLAEVYWYSALISVKNKAYKNAKIDLKHLEKLNSSFKVSERDELLKHINK